MRRRHCHPRPLRRRSRGHCRNRELGTDEALRGQRQALDDPESGRAPRRRTSTPCSPRFTKKFPGVSVKYTSAGDNTPTVLSTAVAGRQSARPGRDRPARPRQAVREPRRAQADRLREADDGQELRAVVDHARHGQRQALRHGLQGRQQVDHLVQRRAPSRTRASRRRRPGPTCSRPPSTLKASGTPAYSIGGADGWTLTDLFENIYLRQAGAAKYDQLATHTIKWTDPSVNASLKTMAQIFSDADNIVGGTSGALQTDFPTSVNNVFADPPKAAMVIEGDFVPGVATTKLEGRDAATTSSRSRRSTARRRRSWAAVTRSSCSRTRPRRARSSSTWRRPAAATIWAKSGRLLVAEQGRAGVAPTRTAITRATAMALAQAKTFRFDMSDLQPGGVRRHRRPGRVEDPPGLPQEPEERDGHGRQRSRRRRPRRTRSRTLSAIDITPTQPPVAPGAGSGDPGKDTRLGRYLVTLAFLGPALAILGRVDRVSGRRDGQAQLLRPLRRQLHRVRQLPLALHDAVDPNGDREQRDLGRRRARARDRDRARLRGAHRARLVGGRVQDRSLHADGDLAASRRASSGT